MKPSNNILLSFPVEESGYRRNIDALFGGYKAWYSAKKKKKWNTMERSCHVNISEKIYSMESIVIVSSVFCHHSHMSQVLLPPFYRLGNWGHRPSREWNPSEHLYPYSLIPCWDRREVGNVWGNPGNTHSLCRPSHHYFSFLSTLSVIKGTECLIDGATDQHIAKLPSR